MLREGIMAPFSEVLINQLNNLETRFKFLARHLPEAGELLESVGRPVPHDLLRELANSGEQFEEVKREVLRVSQPIAGVARPAGISSIKELRAFMQAVSDVVAKQAEHRNVQQAACEELEKVLTIIHVNGIEFAPLTQCQEKARELRDSIAATAWPGVHPDVEALARGLHVFSQFVKFVSHHDELEDEEWERLQELVNESFGKPLGLAASRGKLTVSAPVASVPATSDSASAPAPAPAALAQPATATEAEEETPATTEVMAAEAVPPATAGSPAEDPEKETAASVQVTVEPSAQVPPVNGSAAVAAPDDLTATVEVATETVALPSPSPADSAEKPEDSLAFESEDLVTATGTFEGTLDDIRYMLVLDLIDSKGMAKTLSSKITAASNAATGGDRKTAEDYLKAFIKEVNAQTGKHISGAAPQLLLSDANRLLDQLQ